MAKFGIGQAVTRVEDQRLLTGSGRYTDDIRIPNEAVAYVVRSPHAHAEIASLDTAAAVAAPGVVAVYTEADVAADDLGDLPCLAPANNRDGSPRGDTPRPLLARGRVRHVGDPVALVVAETLNQAKDAAELVEIDYDDLPAVADAVAALADGAPQVWPDIAGNQCFDWEMGDKEKADAAFAAAAKVARIEIVNNRIVVNSMEPRGAVADYDAASDVSTLYVSSQGPHHVRDVIADAVLKIDKDKLRGVTPDVGGGFGMKIFAYAEPALAVWASRKLKRPVRWISDRGEAFVSDTQGRDHFTVAEMAMDANGTFTGMRVTTTANMGGYLSNFAPFIPTAAGSGMLQGLYRTPAIYVNVKGVMTNTVPVDAYRGAGRPEAAYLVERLVSEAARVAGLSPDEIRRRNFVSSDEMPFSTSLGDVYDSGDFAGCMDDATANADWAGFEARRAESAGRGRLRGIGMANYIEKCGGAPSVPARLEFEDDEMITLYVSPAPNGQGHETAYTQVLSQFLDIPAEHFRVVTSDTANPVAASFTGGSRALPSGGPSVAGVAEKVLEKAKAVASSVLETAAADIEYTDGTFTVVGTDRSIGLFEVARAAHDPAHLPTGAEPGLDDDHDHVPEAATFPNGCHICEVEIDPETGVIDVERYTVVDDFGDTVNPLLLRGQVHGGIVQGIGQALHENTTYDEDSGQLITGSFMDYTMPRADDVPNFEFATHNVPCTTNRFGIKGAGEAGAIGAPPAAINAVIDALEHAVGVTHIDMPATPQKIWQILQDNGYGRAAAE